MYKTNKSTVKPLLNPPLAYTVQLCYNDNRKAEGPSPRYERREDMEEGMTANQTLRLIEWLKANGFDDAKIVECLEYINSTGK